MGGLPVVIDVDTGVDDALALLVAVRSPELDVRAVTCVAGNTVVDQVVWNTRTVLAVAGRSDLAVGRGRDAPAADPLARGHGRDGMADLGLAPQHPAFVEPAVELLERVLRAAAEPVHLLALGPLTNVADLLASWPGASAAIARLVVVGGGPRLGPGPADFNLRHDPAATRAVRASDLLIEAYAGTLVRSVAAPDAAVTRLRAASDDVARTAGRLLDHQCARTGLALLGDAGAVTRVAVPARPAAAYGRLVAERLGAAG